MKTDSADSMVHIGGGDLSEQSTINEINSTASSSSSPPPLTTSVPEDPIIVSTSTPLKRSCDERVDRVECSPIIKRPKTDEIVQQKNPISRHLNDLQGFKITVEDGNGSRKRAVGGAAWAERHSSDDDGSSEGSLEDMEEQPEAERLKKYIKSTNTCGE